MKNSKVLIVDDEVDICHLLGKMLSKERLHTSYVTTLSDAARNLEQEPPSLIFLDNHLPDGKGIDFIRHIKTNYPTVKVALITAVDSYTYREMAYNNGADFFISKPFCRENIYQVIATVKNN